MKVQWQLINVQTGALITVLGVPFDLDTSRIHDAVKDVLKGKGAVIPKKLEYPDFGKEKHRAIFRTNRGVEI